MADYSTKRVKQKAKSTSRTPDSEVDPNHYYQDFPSWRISTCDMAQWSWHSEDAQSIMLGEILPNLEALDAKTWGTILIQGKKSNHTIQRGSLNKIAKDRLEELHLELDAVVSLRLTGKHRIYGYIVDSTFNILWVDLDHGDNGTCVCRSHKKHT